MTPDPPEPPTPTLPEITVNVSNAKGVRYIANSDPTEPDLQTYNTFSYNGVDYTLKYYTTDVYLCVPRSANSGDTIKTGFCVTSDNGSVYFDDKFYTYSSGSGSTSVYNVSTPSTAKRCTVTPSNADLDSWINNSNVQFTLRVVQ